MSLLSILEAFNRKERYFVVAAAIDRPALTLGSTFRGQLEKEFGLSIPETAFAAIDYHLDWLLAALLLGHGEIEVGGPPRPDPAGLIAGNQEDIDLLVAFDGGDKTHLILLEAKADAGFTNKQMQSKADHLGRIFGLAGDRFPLVTLHFGLLSPRRPQRLISGSWPSWMTRDGQVPWLQLPFPSDRSRVIRCNAQRVPMIGGNHFMVS